MRGGAVAGCRDAGIRAAPAATAQGAAPPPPPPSFARIGSGIGTDRIFPPSSTQQTLVVRPSATGRPATT